MEFKRYQKEAKKTAKKFDRDREEILTWGLGIAGEAGDVASCIKKTYAHHNDQKKGIRENLGDTLWYMAMICSFYGWGMSKIAEENLEKLRDRYSEGFSEKEAKRDGERIDWNEENKKVVNV